MKIEGLTNLVVAYSVIWVLIFLYVFSLQRRQGRLEREIEVLKRSIQD